MRTSIATPKIAVKRTLRPAAKVFRSVVGSDSALEERIRRALRVNREVIRGPGFVEWNGPHFTIVRSTANPEPKVGIYLRGACDLPSLLAMGPLLRRQPKGTIAVVDAAKAISATRADLLLQTLAPLPPEAVKEASERLRLRRHYFEPSVFTPMVSVPGFGSFPKTVVVLSLAPNVVRTVYRHREQGFLVDPGGWWLDNDIAGALREPEQLTWFRSTFEQVGRLTVEDFCDQFRALIPLVKERSGADHILVCNVLTVEPGDTIHNYQLRKSPEVLRRREFCLALVDLSRELGFSIVDIDRVLKREGIDRQVDFAHFPTDLAAPIAAEAFDVLRSLEVV